DHNQLLMDVMERTAARHNLKVLLHEKPFAGVNGSGKHNNWAMSTNTGVNLFAPGRKPKENLQFLAFFILTIKAVHRYADLLRASIASASNDHRLGANEAPPAIMSVFVGSSLDAVLNELERTAKLPLDKGDNLYLKLGIDKVPAILLDNTDRNRTSPFAFTGNKFEFRAVGSSANCATAMTVLNTIVANQLQEFYAEVSAALETGRKKEVAIIDVLRRYVVESKAIRFEGNGYSQEWEDEAARRGLSNVRTTPQALDAMVREDADLLFQRLGIYSRVELHARHEILLEDYVKKIQIESRVLGDLALNHIVPTAIAYQNKLIANVQGLRSLGLDGEEFTASTIEMIRQMSRHINTMQTKVELMIEARKVANNLEDVRARAISYCDDVKAFFEPIRYAADKLELMVDDEDWPLVKYRELLFRH
ncbi:MAG: glutamine synthetase type III, partial [Hymenobacteraceae bacterium]|nr:glutamine synthetase type III [Hymenobacteraceae bacterium]